MPQMSTTKALVVFSGGQDSTTCLFWAKNRFDDVYAITFDYGQRHAVEIEQARIICMMTQTPHKVIDVGFLAQLSNSALVSDGLINATRADGLPASFVPNRNQLFLTIAHAYAQQIEADRIVTGVCQTDYSGYPDCRQEFIDDIASVSETGSGVYIGIDTPLMYLTKAETFKLADTEGCLSYVIDFSHTCYEGERQLHDWGRGCGKCPACLLRMKGFKEYTAALIK